MPPRQSDSVGVLAAHDHDTQRDRLPGCLLELGEHLVEGRAACLLRLAAPADEPRSSTTLVEHAADLRVDSSAKLDLSRIRHKGSEAAGNLRHAEDSNQQ